MPASAAAPIATRRGRAAGDAVTASGLASSSVLTAGCRGPAFSAIHANSGRASSARRVTRVSKPTPRWYSALLNSPLLANSMAAPATHNIPMRSALLGILYPVDETFDVGAPPCELDERGEIPELLPAELPWNLQLGQPCKQATAGGREVQRVEQRLFSGCDLGAVLV